MDTASQPASQRPQPYLFRPEQMRSLPEAINIEEKRKWETGFTMLYKVMEKSPPDSEEHLNAKNKVQDFSTKLRGKIQLAKQHAAKVSLNPQICLHHKPSMMETSPIKVQPSKLKAALQEVSLYLLAGGSS
jgi:hypothetical protein